MGQEFENDTQKEKRETRINNSGQIDPVSYFFKNRNSGKNWLL
jgi:hypothetical protein